MDLENWRQKAFILAMFASVQSFILIPAAMVFYTGGTAEDPTNPGFSIWNNFLSDLGRLTAYSGLPNLISSLLFNISLFLMGALLIPYFLAMPYFFKDSIETRVFSIIGSFIGIILAFTLIGGSLTPSDVFRPIHLMFGSIAFISTLPMVIFYLFAIFTNKNYPNRYALIFMVLGVVVLTFLIWIILGGDLGELPKIFSTGQKAVVFSMQVCFLIEAYGAWKLEKSWNNH
ncbi:MAG: DUF998 domain-containing protein [Promethearchaeota archaeon]